MIRTSEPGVSGKINALLEFIFSNSNVSLLTESDAHDLYAMNSLFSFPMLLFGALKLKFVLFSNVSF